MAPAANTASSQKECYMHLPEMWPKLLLLYFLTTQLGAQAFGYYVGLVRSSSS